MEATYTRRVLDLRLVALCANLTADWCFIFAFFAGSFQLIPKSVILALYASTIGLDVVCCCMLWRMGRGLLLRERLMVLIGTLLYILSSVRLFA